MGSLQDSDIFWPSQIIPATTETIKEVTRDGGERIAAASLEHISTISASDMIHDNGCGSGAATTMIMAMVSPEMASSIKIKGTDIDEAAVDAYKTRSISSSWSAVAEVMDARALSFSDETFTYSIGNAMIFMTPNNGTDAVREMYRTLKPGGTVIVNRFAYNPHLNAVREASRATRAGGMLPKWDSFEHWQDPAFIASILEAGGFEKNAVHVNQGYICERWGLSPPRIYNMELSRHAECWMEQARRREMG